MVDLKNLSCLLPKIKVLLLNIIDTCPFLNKYILVGGSALTLHICHRKSEDLDFFTYDDNLDFNEILEYATNCFIANLANVNKFNDTIPKFY